MEFDLRLLRAALALADHRNFARAAKAIHVSQPALSRSIQELEQRAGTRLFDRGVAGVEPTSAGQVLLEHARDVMSRASDLGREMDLLTGLEKGELRIGSGTYPTNMFMDRAVGRLLREHPSVRITVANDNWSNLLPLLRKREVDLAIIDVAAAENDAELAVTRLQMHQGYLVLRAQHPLFAIEEDRRADETWKYPFVATSRFSTTIFKELAALLLGPQRAAGLGGKSLHAASCESLHMMKTIALESDAVALLPLNVVAAEVERGELVAVRGPEWLRAGFGIVRLAHRSLSPLGETFVRLVQEADAELLEWEEKTAERLFGGSAKRPTRAKRAR